MKVKTHKATIKRFKVTKKSKVLKRYAGQDHFNTRDPGKITRKKRRAAKISKVYDKTVKTLVNKF
jgi:ribosomal protein L35